MSRVEYIRCDGVDCGRVTPCHDDIYTWGGVTLEQSEGWAVIEVRGRTLHLCPDCVEKAKDTGVWAR